uniref:Putative secreted protein n=1 Tax=Ixodes scapularis TaxID=6945 RepID=A0A4D5RX23_IXOSC
MYVYVCMYVCMLVHALHGGQVPVKESTRRKTDHVFGGLCRDHTGWQAFNTVITAQKESGKSSHVILKHNTTRGSGWNRPTGPIVELNEISLACDTKEYFYSRRC